MDVLIAMEALPSLTLNNTTETVQRGILAACPNSRIRTVTIPSAGGGSALALTKGLGGELLSSIATEKQVFGYVDELSLALIDLPADLFEPGAESCSLGALITSALDQGAQQILLLAPKANIPDCGFGLLSELGAFQNGPESLDGMDKRLQHCKVKLLYTCDVSDHSTDLPGWLSTLRDRFATPFGFSAFDDSLPPFAQALQLGLDAEILTGEDAAAALWSLLQLDEILERSDIVLLGGAEVSPFSRSIARKAADYGALSLAITGSPCQLSPGLCAAFLCPDASLLQRLTEQLFRLIRAAEEQQHPWPDLVF